MKQWTIQHSQHYNLATSRLDYPAAFLDCMPIKIVDNEAIYDLMQTWEFNPPEWYARKGILLHDNEIGHDDKYRYVWSGR